MITARYDIDSRHITVDGHGGGKLGQDIVCAAITILVYTIAENIKDFDAAGMIDHGTVVIESGHADISVSPKDDYTDIIDIILLSLIRGFDVLAANEPGKVQIIRGDIPKV